MEANIGDLLLMFVKQGFGSLMITGSSLSVGFKIFFGVSLVLCVFIYGLRIMFGDLVGTGRELLKTCLWAMFGLAFLDSSLYLSMLVEPIHTLKDNLAIFMVPGTKGTVFSSVQASFAALMGHGMALVDSGSIMTNLMPIVIGAVVMLVCGVYYIAIVANLLFCELSLYILYFLGMFIIPLGAFQSARPIFKSWVKAIAKYGLVFVITGVVVGLIDGAMRPLLQEVLNQSYLDGGYSEGGVSSIYLGGVIVLSCFGAYLMTKAMELAAELTGGVMSEGAAGTASLGNGIKSSMNQINSIRGGVSGTMKAFKANAQGSNKFVG